MTARKPAPKHRGLWLTLTPLYLFTVVLVFVPLTTQNLP